MSAPTSRSLGVVLYQCLSGRRPFEGRGVPQLCASILAADVPEFEAKLDVPDSLVAIVRRCLKKKPGDRYQSVRAASEALGAFRAPRSAGERVLDALRARRGLVALVAGGVALAGMATAGAVFRARVPDEPSAEPVVSAGAVANPAIDSRTSTLKAEAPPAPAPERVVHNASGEVGSVTPPAASAASSSRVVPVGSGARRVASSRSKVEPVPSASVSVLSVPSVMPSLSASAQGVGQPAQEADSKPMYRR